MEHVPTNVLVMIPLNLKIMLSIRTLFGVREFKKKKSSKMSPTGQFLRGIFFLSDIAIRRQRS